jgi:hypothetical protein
VTTQDVYFLALHEPYQSAEHPVPINATIVHAKTLLHRAVPQPTGGLMYRCLTEFPVRFPGCVVPLSTLTYELNGGEGWDQIGDWEPVVTAVVQLARQGMCDAMPLGLPPVAAGPLAHGPATVLTVGSPNKRPTQVGPADRQYHLDQLTQAVRGNVAQGPFWPGDDLVTPPRQPAVLPYQPYSPHR